MSPFRSHQLKMNNLIQFINNKVPLEKELQQKLLSLCNEKIYKKGETILKTGGYCNHFYFLNSGFISNNAPFSKIKPS